uniref:RAS protein activator like 3 n=1 Tax=Loxodonta africana TaxID=9785 RepID=G3TLK8_LOXAF
WSGNRGDPPTMDPPSPCRASQPQLTAPTSLSSYRWHTGNGGEKGAGGSRWGRFTGWGRLSHPEPVVSSQPAPRSLFRRVLSAPQKEPRTSRLRLSKTLWGKHKSPPLEPEPETQHPEPELEPEPEPPAPQIPEAPAPDVPVWDIGGFTLLDGRLVLLGGEQGLRRPRMGSGSSEASIQVAVGNLRDPDRTPGRTEPEAAGLNQVHNVRGLLKRLKEKKKARSELGANTPRDGPPSALGSRESLATLSELDLGAEREVRVWPLHPSLLGEPHCFQVTWAGGSRCFSCRSAAERDRWIEDLRRHFQPSQDNVEREETWLSVWVHEAKGLPRAAAGVRAELWLDGALLARLFWSERFHFAALPPARRLSLRPMGRVALALAELERWFPLEGAPAGAALRARARARLLRVLPSERYKELAEFLTFHYARLCGALESALSAQAKEELAAAMVRVLQATGRAQALVTDLGTAELARCGGREALLFRENTLATKAIDEYMKLVAQDYLQETLGEVVRRLCTSTEDCEVDPSKCLAPELPQHQVRLREGCEEVFENIVHSYDWFPAELGTVFSGWREACKARGSEALGPRLVCASLFLRLLCPAILSPSLFGLAPEHPAPGPARTLTLIAKVIQNLANRAPFGEKEAYMGFMNSFLEDRGPAMQHFLDQVATVDVDAAPSGYQGGSDLAHQLAVLHAQLCTIFAELDQATRDSLEPLPTILRAIEEGRPVPVSVPMRLPPPPAQVHTSFSAEREARLPGPPDLSKHTPLISKSQSLRSDRGAGGWARPRPEEEQRPRPVQRTQSVPAGRHARRRPSVGPRPRPKGSLRTGPAPRGRPWTGVSTSLPRKPSVPWQRQLDEPRDRDQAPGTHRPVGKQVQIPCSLCLCDPEPLSKPVAGPGPSFRGLPHPGENPTQNLPSPASKGGTSQLEPERGPPSSEGHRLKSLERRLAEVESTQAQLMDAVQNLQLLPRTPGFQSQPLTLKAPCANG